MNKIKSPRVSIGLPVYNGEAYLEAAINSVLDQTYSDFELIISDNASTDETRRICESFSKKDDRIKCCRQDENLGAARNFNYTVDESSGQYFMWLAHDDLIAPEYIEKCVDALDKNPEAVLCFTKTVFIDDTGKHLKTYDYNLDVESPDRSKRFLEITSSTHIVVEVFGLIRINILRQTPMIASFMTSDLVLLSELLLHGRFHQLDAPLFFHREHEERSVKSNPDPTDREKWFDSRRNVTKVFPQWRRYSEHFKSALRAPIPFNDRIKMLLILLRVAYWRKKDLLHELKTILG